LNDKGLFEKAQADFYQALSIDPNNDSYYDDLAFFQATCPDPRFRDGQKAFQNASKAYQLTNGNNANNNFLVLAATYAENADFPQATEWQNKAIAQAKTEQVKQRYLARVALYKQGKPYRYDRKTAEQDLGQATRS
jgi:tetratricopeptide (TPR) repeat protein